MKIRQLQQFIAVAQTGSIHAAARQLDLSQPALTKGLRTLETSLGVRLFDRHARGVTPTSYGASFLPRAQLIVAEALRGEQELRSLQGTLAGVLRVAVAPAAAVALMPDAVRLFRRRQPTAELVVVDGLMPSGVTQVRQGAVDLFVGPVVADDPAGELSVAALLSNPIDVACRPGHPLAAATELADLAEADWVFGGPLGVHGSYLYRFFADYGVPPPRSSLQLESFLALLALVADSDLLSIMPTRMMHAGPLRHLLHPIPLKTRLSLPAISVVRRNDSPPTTLALAFVAALEIAARHAPALPPRPGEPQPDDTRPR